MVKDPKKHLVDGKYTIRELVDLKKLHNIFQHFTNTMGFTIGFLSVPDMEILIATGWRELCTKYHRQCPRAMENCRKSNVHLIRQMTKPGKVVIEACANGLVDCAMPIFIKGKCVAILATGQVLLQAPDLSRFRKQARDFGCNEKKYMKALKEIPVISEKRLKQVTEFLKELASLVAELGYSGLKEKEKSEELALDIEERKRAVAALKETAGQLEALQEAVTDGILVADIKTREILKVNPGACEMFGYSEKEFLRKNSVSIHPAAYRKEALRRFRELAHGKRSLVPGFPCSKKDGTVFPADIAAKTVNFEGKPCLVGFFRDITERQQKDTVLRESEERYRSLIETTRTGYVVLDSQGKVLVANKEYVRMTGRKSLNQIRGKSIIQWTADHEKENNKKGFRECLRNGSIRDFETVYVDPQGRAIPILINATNVGTKGVPKILTLCRDITDRKKVEAAMSASEQRLSSLYSNMNEGLALHEMVYADKGRAVDYRILIVNKAYESHTGLTAKRVLGQLASVIYGRREPPYLDVYARVAAGGKSVSFEAYFPPLKRNFQISVFSPKAGQFATVFMDITERKVAEAEILKTQLQYQQLVENAKDGIFTIDVKGRFLLTNPEFRAMLGYSQKEFNRLNILDTYPKDFMKIGHQRMARLRRGETLRFERFMKRKDGVLIFIEATTWKTQDGNIQAFIRDITKRRQAEEALRDSEQRFRVVVNNSLDLVYRRNIQTERYDFFSAAAKAMLGYSPKELIGQGLSFATSRVHPDDLKAVGNILKRAKKGELKSGSIDYRCKHRDGTYRWLSDRFTVVNNAKGRPLYWVGVSRDITHTKKTEEALSESEQRFRKIVEQAPIAMAMVSPSGVIEFINRKAFQAFGYRHEEIPNMKRWWAQAYPEADYRKEVVADWMGGVQKALIRGGEIPGNEYRTTCKDGTVKMMFISGTIISEKIFVLFDDITERKRAEEALVKSEKLYRLLTENSSDVIWTMDLNGKFTYVSPSTFRLRGYTAEEVMLQPLEKQVAPGSLPLVMSTLKRVIGKGLKGIRVPPMVADVEQLCKDGSTVWTEISLELVKDSSRGAFILLGVTRNITARKQAEELLKQREAYLTSIIENQPGMVWLKDKTSRVLAANQMFARMAGRKNPREVMGKTDLDFWSPKLANKYRADDRRVMETREHIMTEELISRKGVLKWHETFKAPVFDENGTVIGTTGYAQDITERKKAADLVRSSEAKLQLQFMSMPIGAILWDTHLRPLSWNPAAEKIFGYSAKEAIGRSAFDFILPVAIKPRIRKIWRGLLQGEKTVHSINENITKSGKTILCRWTNTPLRGNDGKIFGVLSMAEDITKYTKAEEALRASERMLRESQSIAGVGSYFLDISKKKWTSSSVLDDVLGVKAQPEHLLTEWGALVHPDWRAGTWDYLKEVVGKHERFDREYKIIRPRDGQERWVHGLGELEFDGKGRPVRMIGTIMDITERKNLEQALEKRILALTQPVGMSGSITFEDLFNVDEIQTIQDEFSRATGVASIITHEDGTPITKPSNFCRLCNDIIRKTEKGLANCYRSDACLGRPNPSGPIIQPCLSGGLWDAGASITVGGRHVANWLIGQVRDETQSDEKIRAYARQIGADAQKAAEAFHEVTVLTRSKFERVAHLLFTMAKQLSQFAFQNLQQARAITESRRAEALIRAGRHQLFQVIDTVPHMIFAKDKEGRFLLVNRAVGLAYGKEPQELVGVLRQDIHKDKEEAAQFLRGDREVFSTGKPMLVANEPFTDVRGRKHILQTIKIPFKMIATEELCILGVSVDVTEQRKVEEFRNDIVRTVSHELRTPLSIEKEGISILLDGLVGPVVPEQKEILETVMRSIDRLSRMITSLLDISSIETGKIQLSHKMMDLVVLVKDVAFEFKKRAAEKGIDLNVKLPGRAIRVPADEDKITQVLSNLVDNAIKFTPKGGAVEVSLTASEDEVACEVSDNGIGIASENAGKLFEKFQQFSRTAGPGEKGFGLGLSIAKGIVELHGGRIWIKSEIGQGTRVTFVLPLRGSSEPRRMNNGPLSQKDEG